MKTDYNEKFRSSAVEKLLAPGNKGLHATARKIGIPSSTLYSWKRKYANGSPMKKSKNKTSKDWSPEQKLEAIIKTNGMHEDELGQFLRTSGLHSNDL